MAEVFVKADRKGVALLARVVFPRERDAKRPDEPLSILVEGGTTRFARKWEQLEIRKPTEALKSAVQKLRLQLGRDIDASGAYVDRLVLDVYAGGGAIDLYVDDLRVGPVAATKSLPPSAVQGTPQGRPNDPPVARGVSVKVEKNRLMVGGRPYFMRMVRYSGAVPLQVLRDADLNTVLFEADARPELIDEAVNQGFWIVPTINPLGEQNGNPARLASEIKGDESRDLLVSREAQGLVTSIQKFSFGDGVLFWHLGKHCPAEQLPAIERTARAVRLADANRPRGADVWDGFSDYAQTLEMVGAYRRPVATSMSLPSYRDFLVQRRLLTTGRSPNKYMWTWVQTDIPDWQLRLTFDRDAQDGKPFREPVGPQPEQIRLLTYLSIASGYSGVGYWSDKFLGDATQGKDRWLMIATLNQELRMLEPILTSLRETPEWIATSDYRVQAAVLRSDKGVLVLPIWIGDGSQCVPPQGALRDLSVIVPRVPAGSEPWEVSPGRVASLQENSKRTLGGTVVKIPEFDLTAAVVFTDDHSGMVGQWQDRARRVGKRAAGWTIQMAEEAIRKASEVEPTIEAVAPEMANARTLIQEAEKRLEKARVYERDNADSMAYAEARRAMRLVRILMRARWEQAVPTLDSPASSPYAVSYYSLARHWQFASEVRRGRPGANVLPAGDFEQVRVEAPKPVGVQPAAAATPTSGPYRPLKGMEGWSIQSLTLDDVDTDAEVISSALSPYVAPVKELPKRKDPFGPSSERTPTEGGSERAPELGKAVLQLRVSDKRRIVQKNKLIPRPEALERTYLAVHSPAVKLPAGTVVRISCFIRVPAGVSATPDGVIFHDSSAGDALGIRIFGNSAAWKHYSIYRRVPESGSISATIALTGIGIVHVDDLKIEPFGPGE